MSNKVQIITGLVPTTLTVVEEGGMLKLSLPGVETGVFLTPAAATMLGERIATYICGPVPTEGIGAPTPPVPARAQVVLGV